MWRLALLSHGSLISLRPFAEGLCWLPLEIKECHTILCAQAHCFLSPTDLWVLTLKKPVVLFFTLIVSSLPRRNKVEHHCSVLHRWKLPGSALECFWKLVALFAIFKRLDTTTSNLPVTNWCSFRSARWIFALLLIFKNTDNQQSIIWMYFSSQFTDRLMGDEIGKESEDDNAPFSMVSGSIWKINPILALIVFARLIYKGNYLV